MKKTNKPNSYRLLVENILKGDYVTSNNMLVKILQEAEAKREDYIEKLVLEQEEETEEEPVETAGGDSLEGAPGETVAPDQGEEAEEVIDGGEPEDNDTDLGDDLEDATGEEGEEETDTDEIENAVGNAKLTELGDDQVKINCKINLKMISIQSDRLANLKTQLNAMGLEKDEREYVTLDTTIGYYASQLRKLQDKCDVTSDQDEVAERLKIIDKAIQTLESQVSANDDGSTNGVPNVKTTEELNEETPENEETTDDTEGGEGAEETEETSEETEETEETEEEEVEEEEEA